MAEPYDVVPLEVGDRRINFADLLKTPTGPGARPLRFFQTYGFLWELEFKESRFFLANGNKPHVKRLVGECGLARCGIVIAGEKPKEVEVVHIGIGKLVPVEIRDVLLYHELREAYWMYRQKRIQKESHCRARYEEAVYCRNFLTDAEQSARQCFMLELESEAWHPREVSKDEIQKGALGDVSIL